MRVTVALHVGVLIEHDLVDPDDLPALELRLLQVLQSRLALVWDQCPSVGWGLLDGLDHLEADAAFLVEVPETATGQGHVWVLPHK